jgi:hypothetical protein
MSRAKYDAGYRSNPLLIMVLFDERTLKTMTPDKFFQNCVFGLKLNII